MFYQPSSQEQQPNAGEYPSPIQDRFTLMGLCVPAADKLDVPLNIPKCVGTNLVKNEMHC